MSDDEFRSLIAKYGLKREGMVNYKQFCEVIDSGDRPFPVDVSIVLSTTFLCFRIQSKPPRFKTRAAIAPDVSCTGILCMSVFVTEVLRCMTSGAR